MAHTKATKERQQLESVFNSTSKELGHFPKEIQKTLIKLFTQIYEIDNPDGELQPHDVWSTIADWAKINYRSGVPTTDGFEYKRMYGNGLEVLTFCQVERAEDDALCFYSGDMIDEVNKEIERRGLTPAGN